MAEPEDLPCIELVELVTDYLEGALDPVTQARFEAHLAECEGCRDYLDQVRFVIAANGRLAVDELPADTQAAMVRLFRQLSPG
jgi:predicted anti-sigma-YlaC factor YlaD